MPEFDKYGKIVRELKLPKPECKHCGRQGIALSYDNVCLKCYSRHEKVEEES